MSNTNDVHSDLVVQCYEPTGEENEWGNEKLCETTVTYEDDYVGMVPHNSMEGKALRLRCPECGKNHDVCPVCEGGGWYRGESTGKQLACHNCNAGEAARQDRDPFF